MSLHPNNHGLFDDTAPDPDATQRCTECNSIRKKLTTFGADFGDGYEYQLCDDCLDLVVLSYYAIQDVITEGP